MAENLIHDRGRGPELIGTRVTVYNLIPYFLDATSTEAEVCEVLRLTPVQVAAARAYVMTNFAEVMAENARIDERIRRGIEAQDTPEFRERWRESREYMELFRRWVAERDPATVPSDREARVRAFRQWVEEQTASPAGARDVRGIVADQNVEGYLRSLVRLIVASDLADLWDRLELDILTFADLDWRVDLPDREVWQRCQAEHLALFTDNRNHEDETSLDAVLHEHLGADSLPVLTVGSLDRLRHEPGYANRVACDLVETAFDIIHLDRWRGVGRVFLPYS